MKLKVDLIINGQAYELIVDPHRSLLDVLRDQIGLMGAKRGCGHGNCGACTVLMDGKAVNSCLILAGDIGGKSITTIEGLAAGNKLHPLQEAFMKHGAIQCGYCTPGVILNAKALLDENPNPTEAEVRTALEGNLCRCTGYTKIIEAVLSVAGTGKL
ncbi:MAG: (2Fe-2S)-binding protein [Dehalococcoidia bacterium]|nr:(2Fe-2S)-binding protein [Dehalococcoidia bacterium]